MKYGVWNVASGDPAARAALERAGYAPLTACVLAARGFSDPDAAARYLASDEPLIDPFRMRELKTAADRVRLAVARREHIAVFGDYDVDGITATCLLVDFLRSMGGRVTPYIPSRLEEGYGLNPIAIEQLYREHVDLIVTVDCGITANEEALLCKRLGIDLIVTDHHECKQELPYAVAVVDPHRPDRSYPHTDLSGVGIAFKLAAAICGDQDAVLERYADLVCLGLIADVMPLAGEVRTLVVHGLRALNEAKRPGVAALIRESGCAGKPVTTATVGYVLAPRINAAGRMGQVGEAVHLFLTDDPEEASQLAASLCRLNRERQRVEAGIYQQAVDMLESEPHPDAIVLTGEDWHQGVVGIVASRLSEEYCCPSFLICMDGERGKASSRSYGDFNLFAALTELSDLLESYGGHELAAGFTIRREQIPRFREQICARARAYRAKVPPATLRIDCAVSPTLLTNENIESLAQLEPCGAGCPSPVLCIEGLLVDQMSEVGGGKHLRMRLRYGRRPGETLAAIFFSANLLQAGVGVGDYVDVAFLPQINEYRDLRTPQLNVLDIRPCAQTRAQIAAQQALYQRYAARDDLRASDAAQLLPVRGEFVGVWRYLVANCPPEGLTAEPGCLLRRIQRSVGGTLTLAKARICIDVFAEQGLLQLQRQSAFVRLHITSDGQKVDLDKSRIVQTLRAAK